MDAQLHTLKTIYGHASFRGKQLDVITAVLAKRDAVALMATGSGKSLLFQFPTAFGGSGDVRTHVSPAHANSALNPSPPPKQAP